MKKTKTMGWIQLVLGVLMIVLGFYTFTRPDIALGGMVILYGLMAVFGGIADIVFYVQLEKRTGFGPSTSLVSGILSILAGILILCNISAGKWAFTILFPVWFIIRCISGLGNLGLTRLFGGDGIYWLSVISNILGLFLGMVLLFSPYASFVTSGIVVAVYLVILGISHTVIGAKLISSTSK